MKPILLNDLLTSCGYQPVFGLVRGVRVRRITDDSRQVVPGSLFVAVKGEKEDGHRYCLKALKAGAAAVLVDRPVPGLKAAAVVRVADTRRALGCLAAAFYGHPDRKLACVGVTGTNGKTTTAFLIRSVFAAAGRRCGLLGTIGYDAGAGLVPMKNTTPGVVELYGVLDGMVRAGCSHAVMEVSSHALEQGRLGGLAFRDAVFTNLTREHLDYHKTMARYFAAKKKLFNEHLAPGAWRVVNRDDAYGARLGRQGKGRLLTYGLSPRADVRARLRRQTWAGSHLDVVTPRGAMQVMTPLVGRHNVYNVLAALAVGVAEGLKNDVLRRGVHGCAAVPGRLERVENDRGIHVFVDYAHTDDALKNVLESLRRIPHNGSIITVFGCGGERDRGKRPRMGRAATRLSDYAVVTSDNPRSEDPEAIIREILGGVVGTRWEVVVDRRRAIGRALARARRGDVVLIAGKGHEACQFIGNAVIPFDDRRTAREFLA
ncbi:MAG: UDP-N-acetylmuramoyl-L-alanyl-D-glutamate--2,6-diaminopimelate ligase [Deltaproteobacteria bacterium]